MKPHITKIQAIQAIMDFPILTHHGCSQLSYMLCMEERITSSCTSQTWSSVASSVPIMLWKTSLLRPGSGAEYCNQLVCLSVCLTVCKHISGTAGLIVTKFFVQTPCGCRSVPLWRRCDMLCTSGFTDDVTFGHMAMCGWLNLNIPHYR